MCCSELCRLQKFSSSGTRSAGSVSSPTRSLPSSNVEIVHIKSDISEECQDHRFMKTMKGKLRATTYK